MKMFRVTDERGHQPALRIVGGRIFLLLVILMVSNFSYAICVNDSGLGPVQITTAVNNKQVQILKKVTSKQTAKKATAKLKECRKQKLKANRVVNGDVRVWIRTEANGNKKKEQILFTQHKLLKKSYPALAKQLFRINKDVPEIDILMFSKTTVLDYTDRITQPKKLLSGKRYFLKNGFSSKKIGVGDEIQFIDNEFAIVNSHFIGKGSLADSMPGLGGQEVVKWIILKASHTVPFESSMGLSNKELEDYDYLLVEFHYMDSTSSRLKSEKQKKLKYLNITRAVVFLANIKKGEITLGSNHDGRGTSRRILYSKDTKDVKGAIHSIDETRSKRWSAMRQYRLDLNKKRISELCAEWKKASIKNPYCKKFIAAIDSVSVKQKKYIPTSDQKLAMQESKKLTLVASQYLFQPIKDYSDSAPIPTSLPYAALIGGKCSPAWYAERQKTGFADTLWSLRVTPKRYELQPGDNKEEYLRYTKALTMWSNMEVNVATGAAIARGAHRYMLHLRKDGVFGLSWSPTYKVVEKDGKAYLDAGKKRLRMYYDPTNRWIHLRGNRVALYWQNSKQAYPLSGAAAKYEFFSSNIISNYTQLISQSPEGIDHKSPAYAKLKQAARAELVAYEGAKNRDLCGDSKASSSATATPTQKAQQTKSPKAKKPQPEPSKQTLSEVKPSISSTTATKKTSAGTLIGCWKWANGGYVVVDANGKARNGAVKASWETIDKSKGRYMIVWPPITDTLTLSKNGKVLSGSNSFNLPVSAKRQTGSAPNLFGRWLWSNGVTVDIHQDNTVSAGVFHGKLRKAGKNWKIEWPVDDAITLSANGNGMNLRNQFGALTATRDKSCKKR